MDDRRRQELLDRARRSAGTLGESIPETIDLQDRSVALREFVFECERLDTIPEAGPERERIEAMKTELRRERLRRIQRLETDADLTEADAEVLVRSVHGIDRALTALEGLDTPDFGEQRRQERLESARELLSLVRQRPE